MTRTRTQDELVTLRELCGTIGVASVSGLVAEEHVMVNWRGDRCVTEDVAAAVVTAFRADHADCRRRDRERAEAAEEHQEERARVYREAYAKAYEKAQKKGAKYYENQKIDAQARDIYSQSPQYAGEARDAALEAVAEFDRKHGGGGA